METALVKITLVKENNPSFVDELGKLMRKKSGKTRLVVWWFDVTNKIYDEFLISCTLDWMPKLKFKFLTDSNLYVVVRDDEQGSEYQGILPNSETLLTLKVKMDVV